MQEAGAFGVISRALGLLLRGLGFRGLGVRRV